MYHSFDNQENDKAGKKFNVMKITDVSLKAIYDR